MERNEKIVKLRRDLIESFKRQKGKALVYLIITVGVPILLAYVGKIDFVLDFVNHIAFVMYCIINIIIAYFIYVLLMNKQLTRFHNAIIVDDCDHLLLKDVYHGLCVENIYKVSSSTFSSLCHSYLNVLVWLEEYEEAQIIFNHYFSDSKLVDTNMNLLSYRLNIAKYKKDKAEFYKVYALLQNKVKDTQTLLRNEIGALIFDEQYALALEKLKTLQETDRILITRVNFQKGLCLYKLERKEEAIPYFEKAIEVGNTSVYVKHAQDYIKHEENQETVADPEVIVHAEMPTKKGLSKFSKILACVASIMVFIVIVYTMGNTVEVDEEYEDLIVRNDAIYFASKVGSCEEYDHFVIETYLQTREKIIFGGTASSSEYDYDDKFVKIEDKVFDENKKMITYTKTVKDKTYYVGILPYGVKSVTYEDKPVTFTSENFATETMEGSLTSFIVELEEEETFFSMKLKHK